MLLSFNSNEGAIILRLGMGNPTAASLPPPSPLPHSLSLSLSLFGQKIVAIL